MKAISLPPELVVELKPQIMSRADAILDKAKRMVESRFSARELECLWAGAMEWSLFARSLIPLNSEERFLGTQDTIAGKLDWLLVEFNHQIELARANGKGQ